MISADLSTQTTLDSAQYLELKNVLQDIAHNVTIESDLAITHPQHKAIEVPIQLQMRFEVMSDDIKQSYLQAKLKKFLYDYYYRGVTSENKIPDSDLIPWSEREDFIHELKHKNHGHGQGYYQSGWLIVGETEEGFLQIKKDDLTLHIRNYRHLRDEDQEAKMGDVVDLKMPAQIAEPDFYVGIGTAGSINNFAAETKPEIVDIYFNLSDAEGALVLMDKLTESLNAIAIPFHFKVLYRTEEYIYRHTAMLSFSKDQYQQVEPILKAIYQENKAHFQPETALFTKYLAPGLSIAERPALDIDFAQHRCQLIAEGLITAWKQEKTTPEEKLNCISDRFKQENINLEQIYLNPNSTDIYSVI